MIEKRSLIGTVGYLGRGLVLCVSKTRLVCRLPMEQCGAVDLRGPLAYNTSLLTNPGRVYIAVEAGRSYSRITLASSVDISSMLLCLDFVNHRCP